MPSRWPASVISLSYCFIAMKLEALGLRMQPASEPTGSTLGQRCHWSLTIKGSWLPLEWYPAIAAPGTGFVKTIFMEWVWHEDGFQDDSSTLCCVHFLSFLLVPIYLFLGVLGACCAGRATFSQSRCLGFSCGGFSCLGARAPEACRLVAPIGCV